MATQTLTFHQQLLGKTRPRQPQQKASSQTLATPKKADQPNLNPDAAHKKHLLPQIQNLQGLPPSLSLLYLLQILHLRKRTQQSNLHRTP